ncbi:MULTISPECIES: molybdopterin dinucleotide binding domain-containing protein [Streptomyces]|uniref:Molybdopterin dinucleotide binding domain-containing protein n=2 Tax=Streptomyces TaxID=1883 RepID=A0ABU4KF86_9ACTN|nr:molybdopterin dinucleotide binding domain-containing protein [Streptomyces roseolus]MDX2296454.1 molybdopterin dinucleotide binding domain-containing protein [Streptomyces roseolus]
MNSPRGAGSWGSRRRRTRAGPPGPAPEAAARHGLRDGTPVTVESRHGQARLVARVGTELAPGQVFCAFHFPASGVDSLTPEHADTATPCPECKVTALRLRPAAADD